MSVFAIGDKVTESWDDKVAVQSAETGVCCGKVTKGKEGSKRCAIEYTLEVSEKAGA